MFLNTISLLEHLGSRKILMTQSHEGTPEIVLNHASEEARHALFFKKKITKVLPDYQPTYKNEELLCGFSAKIYFQRLDAYVKRSLKTTFPELTSQKRSFLNYLYTTTLVELRAMEVYEIYDSILEDSNIGFRITTIIKEEVGHLNGMQSLMKEMDSDHSNRLEEFVNYETYHFKKFLTALENSLN